jgi:guanylate kinase|tara:strand:+ start:1418 stop:2032 length:615 start_codon:yes stop_codon:yes gene_type:complete
MFSLKDGKMIILSSPSGAGKTTLAKKISQEKHFKISVSHTTREPRSNEINGVDYFFVSQKQFEKLIEEKAFLEYANVFKNLYGSTKEQVIKNLENGDNVIFDIDWQGAQQIKNQVLNFELVTFFILPPSKKVLLQRLITRDENKDEIIQMRMKQFDKDVLHWIDYDFVVINEDLNKCYNEIIGYLNKTIKYDKEKIKKHIDTLI